MHTYFKTSYCTPNIHVIVKLKLLNEVDMLHDKPQKNYVKKKKPDTKDYTLYNFVYIKIIGIGKPIETWVISMVVSSGLED
jgi:hypothetical protein